MGYRSEVYIRMSEEAYVEFKEGKLNKGGFVNETKVLSDGSFYVSMDWIKWYEDYDHIIDTEEMFSKWEEKDIKFAFIRQGEDVDDFETRGTESEWVCSVARCVSVEINPYWE